MATAATNGFSSLGTRTSVTAVVATQTPEDAEAKAREVEFMNLARERFDVARTAEDNRRREMLIDLQFRCGNQWDATVKLRREQQGRPCLENNRIPGFLKHVTNAMRQARPEIKVDPIGDGADEEIAEIRQGLIRHILINSHFEVPADTAFEQMCTMGLGWLRVVDVWDGFDKELLVEWICNAFSVYSDPSARRPDWSDAKWRFIVEDVSFREFQEKFPHNQAVGADNFQSIGDHSASWYINGKIRLAEYFYIEEEEDVLCQLPDGSTQLYSEMDTALLDSVVQTRQEMVPKVHWVLMNGLEVLKDKRGKPLHRIWKGKIIPVLPVIGNQIELDGERLLVGMVRYAREAQRMYNYAYSCMVEAVALAPKSPFVAEFSQIEDFKDIWATANSDVVAYLPYKMKTQDGMQAPPPQRQQAEPPIAAFVNLLKLADQNLKAAFSIYEAALGERGPQESGIAINSRKIETDVATFDWIDNFVRSLHLLGITLNDLLKYYYNGKGRIVQIVREDLSTKSVTLNQVHKGEDGEDTIYDLSKGKFGIMISTGPSFSTRRQEAAHSMLELAKVYPPLMQVAGPIVVKSMDWPQKDAIAAQLEKAMPPELREQDPNQQTPNAQEQAQKLQQLQGMIQQLSEALHQATDAKELAKMKEDAATDRTLITTQANVAIAEMKTGLEEAKFMNQKLFEEFERLRERLENPQPQPTNSGAPASAAPSAPAPQVPPKQGMTPGGVGSAEQTV